METIKNIVRIKGTDYKFSIDNTPIDGSDNPISSNAVAQLKGELLPFIGRPIADTISKHGSVTYNDSSIPSSEAIRTALDDIYNKAEVNSKFSKVKDALVELGLTDFDY